MRKQKQIWRLCIALVLVITVLWSGMAPAAAAAGTDEGMQDSQEGFSMDGAPPDLPDGEDFGGRGNPPDGQMPGGMGGFPGGGMQGGDFQPGDMPDGEMPFGEGEEMPENGDFSGRFNFGDGDFTGKFGDRENFGNRDDFSSGDSQTAEENIDLETIVLLGASFLILIGGLLFAKFYG